MDSTVWVGGKNYPHCLVVLEMESRTLKSPVIVIREYAYSVYAPYLGKIKRLYRNYRAQVSNGQEIPETTSRIFVEELVD